MPFEHVTTPMKPAPANDMAGHRIASLGEYETATERVRELADYPESTPQAEELAGLVRAIMQWDQTHDDATAWN